MTVSMVHVIDLMLGHKWQYVCFPSRGRGPMAWMPGDEEWWDELMDGWMVDGCDRLADLYRH
jgi:hypothetical protein